jgi:catechol 2,3-dioxygenase-like lactoylglutathione lyase family enzyme
MLTNSKVTPSFSAIDLEKEKDFFVNTLGLKVLEEIDGAVTFEAGNGTKFFVYLKGEAHTPASFTVLNFEVEDILASVEELKSKGVVFEQYPEMGTDENGISSNTAGKMAWFKDPSENIFSLIQN